MNLRPMKCFCACLIAYTVVTAVPRIAAASDGDALTDKARVLYDEAAISYKKSNYAEARASLLAAWSLKKHWQIAGSLGGCEVQLGLYRDAAEHLAYFMRLSPNKPPSADTKALFEKATAKLGALEIAVDAPGADVVVDGKFIGKSPMEDPVFVEPGHHTIEARLGPKRATAGTDAPAGSSRKLSLALMDAVPPGSGHGEGPNRPLVIGGAIISAAALGTGIALVVAAGGKGSSGHALHETIAQAGHSCIAGAGNYDARCTDLSSFSSSADTLQNAGVGLLVGAGSVAVGTAMYFFWPRSSADAAVPSAIHVVPAVSATNAGLVVSGSF